MNNSTGNHYIDYWSSNGYLETPRQYRALNFYLTTFCNRRCPECGANIPQIKSPEHYPVDYIRHAAERFYGIEQVSITGGEPLLHPQFKIIAPNLKKWFGCLNLTLESNGCDLDRYKHLMKYFDDIMISHYSDNYKQVRLAEKLGLDGRPAGQTLHVTTARRARRPAICRRANFAMYVYGRVYPCACIPDGYAFIGIPLTENWRGEIPDVPMPCADCCFAEEADDAARIVPPVDRPPVSGSAMPGDRGQVREESRWPDAREDIQIFGLELDSWMGHEALIRVNPAEREKSLCINVESYVPADFHPLTLGFISEKGATVESHVIRSPGSTSIRLDLKKFIIDAEDSLIRIHCDKVYTGSGRELGVRVCSLNYGE